jgi:large subunit ribosomal protein L22
MTDIKAEQKYILISPRKLREIAEVIRDQKPVDVVARLPFVAKRGSEHLVKVVKSALASARSKGFSDKDMVFKEIAINEGPRLKRGQPVSRGQWHPIKKRMSHIRVVLTTRKSEAQNSKSETNSNVQNLKSKTEKKDQKNV